MSRFSIKSTMQLDDQTVDIEVCYGLDHACGYFIQVFIPEMIDDYSFDPSGEGIYLDKSSYIDQMSNGAMLELWEKYDVPQMHRTELALDLPIGKLSTPSL